MVAWALFLCNIFLLRWSTCHYTSYITIPPRWSFWLLQVATSQSQLLLRSNKQKPPSSDKISFPNSYIVQACISVCVGMEVPLLLAFNSTSKAIGVSERQYGSKEACRAFSMNQHSLQPALPFHGSNLTKEVDRSDCCYTVCAKKA